MTFSRENSEQSGPECEPVNFQKQRSLAPVAGCLSGWNAAAAALWVLLHHTYMEVVAQALPLVGPIGWMVGWLLYGHFAVTVFIVLAGYSLMLTYAR